VCRLRAIYGVCFQSGRLSIVALALDSLFEWALYMDCASDVVRLFGWNSGRKRVIPVHAVLVRGSAE